MWVDTHCHLDDDKVDIAEAAAGAEQAGVAKMVTIGCAKDEWQSAIELTEGHQNMWAALGVHPHEAKDGIGGLKEVLDHDRVVAVGECGLDYYYDHSDRSVQREAFAKQIVLAHELELPLVIHTRDAWDETFEILRSEGVPPRLVFHCFSGGVKEAELCLELGAFLSFSGIVTFPSAANDVAVAAKVVPEDRFVLETDAPYLAPVPLRGQTNLPHNVPVTGAFIANLRGVAVEHIASTTTKNAEIFFGI